MSKKVKCIDCSNSMHWEIPEQVKEENYEYAKLCLHICRTSIVCGETMKNKSMNHEQYCKKFIEKDDRDRRFDVICMNECERLQAQIEKYESTSN